MSTFTDDDMKRLKGNISSLDDYSITQMYAIRMIALIARLEAAEAAIDEHRGDCLVDTGASCTCGYSEILNKWRKAAGKS